MWSVIFVLIFLAIAAWIVFVRQNEISVLSARAGHINTEITESLLPMKISRDVRIQDKNGEIYDLSDKRYLVLRAAGDSLQQKEIKKGDVLIFDKNTDPHDIKEDQVIALNILGPHIDTVVGEIKLRLFSRINDVDGKRRISVNDYRDGTLRLSRFDHPVESLSGVLVKRIDSKQTQRFLSKYSV